MGSNPTGGTHGDNMNEIEKKELFEKIRKAGGFCNYLRSLGPFNNVEIPDEPS